MFGTRARQARRPATAEVLNQIGNIAYLANDYAQAAQAYDQALTIARTLGDQALLGRVLNNLGHVALQRLDYARGERLLGESLALARSAGDQVLVPRALLNLGHLVLRSGDRRRAEDLVRKSFRLLREVGDRGLIASGLDNLAIAAGGNRQYARAVRLFGAFRGLSEAMDLPFPPFDHAISGHDASVAACRAALGAVEFDAAWAAVRLCRSSNREIGDHLVIGRRTVDTHLTNIKTKLDLHRRVQITAWAIAHGLATPPNNYSA